MESGNPVEYARLPEGPLRLICYDASQDIVSATQVGADLAAYIHENSYGRNSLSLEPDADCYGLATFPASEPEPHPNIFRFPINCPSAPFNYQWSYRTIRHEFGHSSGGGSGQLWNAQGYVRGEGDPYEPMGAGGGHFAAPNKEVMGYIGPFAQRPFIYVTGSGTFVISNIEAQSDGYKAIKLLKSRWTLTTIDGTVVEDIRWFYYFELRANHHFIVRKGKGKAKAVVKIAPGIQIREGRPVYDIEMPAAEQRLHIDYGNNGGLEAGTSFSGEEVITTQKQFDQPQPVVVSRRPFTARAAMVDANMATVTITYG